MNDPIPLRLGFLSLLRPKLPHTSAGLAIADSPDRSAIDTLVYQLYGLSVDDISLIEEHTRSVS